MIEKKYINYVNELRPEIYKPLLSESTKRIGRNLTILSFLFIILLLGKLKIKEIDVLGLKLEFYQPAILIIFTLVGFYITLQFVISVILDRKARPYPLQLEEITTMFIESIKNIEETTVSNNLKFEQIKKQREYLQDKLNVEEFIEYCKNDGLENIKQQVEEIIENNIEPYIKDWRKNLNSIQRLHKVQFYLYVVFPILIFTIALGIFIFKLIF
jgi:hypothetical protein